MRVLVFGKSGQVATELQRLAAGYGVEVVALGRDRADLTDLQACAEAVLNASVDVVINAAAHTAVDRAETEADLAMRINAEAPGAMARAAARRGIPFVQISTDYVFDGSGTQPWRPGDATGPLGAYGRSKLAGEAAVAAVGGTHVILRTSWVFSAHGSNFVKTMLRLGKTRDALGVVADQIGGPTAAGDIAKTLLRMAQAMHNGEASGGIHHFSGCPDVSWADFAREVFAQSGLQVRVDDIPGTAYPTAARRPGNSRLDCTSLEADFAIGRPDWRVGLAQVLQELKEI